MQNHFARLLSACLLSLTLAVQAHAVEAVPQSGKIPIHIEEPSGKARIAEPVQLGVPFAAGVLKEATVRLLDPDGKEVSAAATVSVRWSKDQSVKWLILDFQADVPAKGSVTYTLEYKAGLKPKAPAFPVKVVDDAERIQLVTSAATTAGKRADLKFSVAKKGGGRLESVTLGDKEFISSAGKHDLTWDYQSDAPKRDRTFWRGSWKIPEADGAKSIRSTAKEGYQPEFMSKDPIKQFGREYVKPGQYKLEIEEQNAMRVVLRVNGWYAGKGRTGDAKVPNCFYIVRYVAYAGKPYLKMEHSFVFSALPTSVLGNVDPKYYKKYGIKKPDFPADARMLKLQEQMFMRRLGFSLPVTGAKKIIFGGGAARGTETPGALGFIAGTDNPGELLHTVDVTPEIQQVYLLSKGPKIHHNGVTPAKAKEKKEESYDVVVEKKGAAKPVGEGEEQVGPKPVAQGARSRGFVSVEGKAGTISLCVRNFFKQHPNELQVDLKNGLLWAWLWADHGGVVLDNWNPKYGRKVGHPNDTTLGGQANGWSKTHECLLLFDERPADQAVQTAVDAERQLNGGLWPYVDPAYGCGTGAAGSYAAVDTKRYPGMENQIKIAASMLRLHQELLHWNGFFDYGDHMYEYNQHGVRRSRGPRSTYCWTDYAGWALNDGNVAHHWWVCWFRSGNRLYRELAENLSRRINDETTSHWQAPELTHDVQHAKGGGHRHDQSPWHGISTHYGSDWLGAIDCFTMTGYGRSRDWVRNNMYRLRRRGIWGLAGAAAFLALSNEIYPADENIFVKGAKLTSETDERGLLQVMSWNRSYGLMGKGKAGPGGWDARDKEPLITKKSYGFRGFSQLLLPMEYQVQVCLNHPDKALAVWGQRTKDDMLAMAKALTPSQTYNHHPARMFAWAYLNSGDNAYLTSLFTALRSKIYSKTLAAAVKYKGTPLKAGWGVTAVARGTVPGYHKQHWILWNVSCWPETIMALQKAGITEADVLSGKAEALLKEKATPTPAPAEKPEQK